VALLTLFVALREEILPPSADSVAQRASEALPAGQRSTVALAVSMSLVSASNGGEGAVSGDTLAVVYADGSMDDVEKDVRLGGRQPRFALLR
jgi:hypothetical protein